MTTASPPSDRRHARRLLVTVVITTAAAAVTAGAVLRKHAPAVAAVQHAAAGQALVGVAKDVRDDGATRSDPSLPSAADALQRATESAEEPATF